MKSAGKERIGVCDDARLACRIPPMFKDAFIKLEPAQAQQLVATINPHLDIAFDPSNVSVLIHDLSFYPGHFLAEIARHDLHPPQIRTAVCNEAGKVVILNWTNETIYALNKAAPLLLNKDTRSDYIRFFFHYVRGKHGRFLIIDGVDDIDWREEPAASGRKALSRMIEPLTYLRTNAEDGDVFRITLVFRDSLFQAEAHLKPDGHLSLHKEELLVEGMPIADDLFAQ